MFQFFVVTDEILMIKKIQNTNVVAERLHDAVPVRVQRSPNITI